MATIDAKSLVGIYNPRDFGFRGGDPNDVVAINRAITAANVDGGGTVVIPSDAGTITLYKPISLKSNVALVIPHGVTLKAADGIDRNVVQAIGAPSNVRVSGGGIVDGNRTGQNGYNDQVPCDLAVPCDGVYFDSVTDLVIEEIRIQNARTDGLAVVGCTRVRIDVPRPRNSGRYDAYVDSDNVMRKKVVVQRIITVAALSNTAVLASTALADGQTTTVTANITNPDEYRALRIVGNQAGITGVVTVNGTDWDGNAISETITANGTTAVNGNKPFRTVTSIVLPARNAGGDEISVGYCDKLGLHRGIAATADVLEVARKATAASEYTIEATGTVSAVYGTVLQSSAVTGDDSFEITYLTWEH